LHKFSKELEVDEILDKQIEKMARKAALKLVTEKTKKIEITDTKQVYDYLGIEPFSPEELLKKMPSGVATGLAWTAYGGEVLFVESSAVKGKGGFTLTGQLGEVMQESASIAYTYVKEHAKRFKIPANYFDKHHLHIHVPQGATPKDGPSAGVTMVASLLSLFKDRPLNHKKSSQVAMTGEITLKGRVLPVGGIKEKLLAAKRSNIKTIILPKLNEKELDEVTADVKEGLNFIKVSTVDEMIHSVL
jgi:ATP-dependent Lon protease